MLAMDTFSVVS